MENLQRLSQKTSLTITQQLTKNIGLLAHSVIQIREDILKEIDENPALELVEEPAQESLEAFENKKNNSSDAQKEFEFVESILVSPRTLKDYLNEQLYLEIDTDEEIEIGLHIIQNLDSYGFYREDPFSLLDTGLNTESNTEKKITVTEEQIKKVLHTIQGFDPIGCATSGIIESLTVQVSFLTKDGEIDKNSKEKLMQCIKFIKKANNVLIKKIDEQTQLSVIQDLKSQISEYLSENNMQDLLYAITPYPALAYNSHYNNSNEQYIIPDATIKFTDNTLRVIINNTIIPVVSISKEIKTASQNPDKKTAKMASEMIQSAETFIQGLEYRSSTLEKIITYICKYHKDFFLQQQDNPTPLTRAEIAKVLSLNESTISRVVSGKYIHTPRGLLELKTLLSRTVGSNKVSAEQIKQKIQNIMTDHTDLSDNKIVTILAKKNVVIARRTVAKYRKQIEIEK